MRIKRIKLENIRSYKEQEVEFPEGSTLLSGDIGSGKTSILLGIEFALFGLQPGQRGNSLLRNGEKEGRVEIEFETDGQKIVVERTLKRGKSVSQDSCLISIDGEKREYSVTELKDKILEILSYPKEFSRKQNLLYKFTVYTPQEEMKQIILQDPETRINTLRYVFGIDKYKRILENASLLATRLREEKKLNEGIIENFEQDRELLEGKEDELEAKYHNLSSVEKELFLKTETRKKVYDEKEKISEKIEEKNRMKQEIEKMKIMILNKKESLASNEKLIERINLQISEARAASSNFDESKIGILENEILILKKRKKDIEEEKINISSEINSLELKNNENDSIKNKILTIEVCPTCLQDVNATYRMNVTNRLESEKMLNKKRIEALDTEKRKISDKITEVDSSISEHEKSLSEVGILKVKLNELKEREKRVEELQTTNNTIRKDTELLESQVDKINISVFELKKFDNLFEEKEKDLEKAMKDEKMAEIKVAELKKEIEVFGKQIDELKDRLKRSEKIKEKLEYITKLETWISKIFSGLVSLIEKNVMIKLKSEFSELFAQWFSMLVSDTFDVRLDENFTPIIEHQDYELDYSYLSGGERTAIALAYRLSLNQVVNSLLSKIKTRDLVILDEPTDGFSEQQLDKMRDVLRQLEIGQLIIVSHEQKIEGFVENVIKFKKDHGISKVTEEKFI